jgi:hypothetical protein
MEQVIQMIIGGIAGLMLGALLIIAVLWPIRDRLERRRERQHDQRVIDYLNWVAAELKPSDDKEPR